MLLLLIPAVLILSSCQQESNQYDASEVRICSNEKSFTNGIKHLLGQANRSVCLLKSTLKPITDKVIAYENGIPKYETYYKNGIQVGLYRSWYANGKKEVEESLG